MRKILASCITAITMLTCLAGCHSTAVTGAKLSEPTAPVKRIYIYADDTDRYTDPNFPEIKIPPLLISTQRQILDLLAVRLPAVFVKHGIDAKVVLKSRAGTDEKAVQTTYPYYMEIVPGRGTFSPNSGTSIILKGHLVENATRIRVWQGETRFLNLNNPTLLESAGDHVAEAILSQLQKDGLIK
jgi:hypothetical protein